MVIAATWTVNAAAGQLAVLNLVPVLYTHTTHSRCWKHHIKHHGQENAYLPFRERLNATCGMYEQFDGTAETNFGSRPTFFSCCVRCKFTGGRFEPACGLELDEAERWGFACFNSFSRFVIFCAVSDNFSVRFVVKAHTNTRVHGIN